MYWEQIAAMRVSNDYTGFQQIKRGVRQGCVLSPDLFSLYSEHIMHNIIDIPSMKIGGHNISNVRYADDIVLKAENDEDLNAMLELTVLESSKKSLSMN